jgi:hypothetical protein
MIVLGALVRLPTWATGTIGVVLIATHNMFDGVRAGAFGSLAPLRSVLHAPGFVIPGPTHVVFAAYALIPWIGVTAAGYALGAPWDLPPDRRRTLLVRMGVAMAALFVLLLLRLHRVRRSGAVERAGDHGDDARLVPEPEQVSALAALPAHDAWAGAPAAPRARRPHAEPAVAGAGDRPRCRWSTSCGSRWCWRSIPSAGGMPA